MLEQRLNLKMTQKLMMTPQLQQAIKLLQYQKLELQEIITQEIVENPVLEEIEAEDETPEEAAAAAVAETPETPPAQTEKQSELGEDNSFDDFDFSSYFQDYLDMSYQPRNTEIPAELPSFEATMVKEISLAEHLLWQLSELAASTTEAHKEIARAIIGNINDEGYLAATIEEIAAMGPYSEADTLEALRLVQSLDPVGVAARDLVECLLIQLQHLGLGDSATEIVVKEHLELLKRWRIEDIAKRMNISVQEVMAHVDVIKHLDPKPGSKYSEQSSHYVVPDVYVRKVDGELQVLLNEDGMPKLRISPVYRRLLAQKDTTSAETRQFVNEKFKAALWLIRSLEQRQRTIYKVAESIVRYQKAFFEKGIDSLQPLVLRDVADDIGMHESTVSRVVTNKYMHTPRGLFEMKYFFHSSIQSETGRDVSSLSVKQKIKKHIEVENPAHPLSDSKIVKLLKQEGLEIARRTVAKYREELKIAPSNLRRQQYQHQV